jgi:trimeric autotransporter adhesin
LQVFGTITKDPVATGADLVAYSGFSASNYLEQPYNSDLNFGTGDFCIMGWAKSPTANTVVFDRADSSVDLRYSLSHNSSGYWQFYMKSGASALTLSSTTSASGSSWQHICFVRVSGVLQVFINGVFENSTASTLNITGNSQLLVIGAKYNYTETFNGSLALFRISATAPTAAQIAKIYEDEKVLFQENSKATLYGSSDSVTALAYDDDTELLHVGTSEGRSVFQGLRRVDNTTGAVGAAISASNGLVAED